MAQSFVTTYRNCYRWHKIPRTELCYPREVEHLLDDDIWITDAELVEQENIPDITQAKAAVRRMIMEKMKTTYQRYYCRDFLKQLNEEKQAGQKVLKPGASATSVKHDEQIGSKLIDYCNDLYGKKDMKLLPPLNTARTIYGHLRPERFFTPLTTYQKQYGKVGCDILTGKVHHY